VGKTDTITDGAIHRTHTLEHRFTGAELKAKFILKAKAHLKQLWKRATEELDYLENFDSGNLVDIGEWQQYKNYLKSAFVEAKSQLQAIDNYADGVEFVDNGFNALLPTTPDELE